MADWYQKSSSEVLEAMQVTTDGHSRRKADELLLKHGENALAEGKKKTALMVFLSQFADLLVIILIAAAIISMFSGNIESTIVIFAVIIMNAILGTVQHIKAEKSLESLKSLSSPSAKVIRDGQKIEIDSKKIVPGDIVILEAGDMVVADGRIIHNYSLQVNESSLTGESTNIDKTEAPIEGETPLGDRTNMVFSGSLVTYGRAMVVVTETAMDTEIGKIAALMNSAKEKKTPLQQSLDQFSARLAIIIMAICALVFVLSMWQGGWKGEAEFFERLCRMAGCAPREMVLFEDSLYAIRTAAEVGVRCVGVRDATNVREREEMQRHCLCLIDSFEELMPPAAET